MGVKQKAQVIYMRKIDAAARLLEDLVRPKEGWIVTMRKALGMSGPQLAKRAGVTKAAIYQAQRKELAGEVTIKQMEKLAASLGGKFVYAIVPDQNSISLQERSRQKENGERSPVETLILAQARGKAEAVVAQANTHMTLEEQGIGTRLKEAEIERLTTEFMIRQPLDFWEMP